MPLKLILLLILLLGFWVSALAQQPNTTAGRLAISVSHADAVIVGKVLDVSSYNQDPDQYDEVFFTAKILVVERLKANPADEITVVFTEKAESPKLKLHKNEQAVMILYRSRSEKKESDYYFIFTSAQIQPMSSLSRIKKLFENRSDHHQNKPTEQQQLEHLVINADLVVVGEITVVSLLNSPNLLSENNPRTEVASVEVSRVLKCTYPNCQKQLVKAQHIVEVVYPGSQALAWRDHPKLRLGQKGIFILFDDNKKLNDAYLGYFTELQFQPLTKLGDIKKFLR